MNRTVLELVSASVEETEKAGATVAGYSIDNSIDFIALYGDLGAGKTAFTRGIASVVAPDAAVCSPTYAIVNEYKGKIPLFHFDMYRIEDEDSLDSIGFYDYFSRGGIIVTEWSERIEDSLPDEYLRVELKKVGENSRRITVEHIDLTD